MARRKNAVALFEVITATNKKKQEAAASRPAQPILRTPKWWFKSGKTKAAPSDTIDENSFSRPALPPAQYSGLLASPAPLPEQPSEPSPAQAVVQRVAPPPQRVTIPEQVHGVDPFGLDIPDAPETPARTRRPWLNFGPKKIAVDPDRKEVTLRVRYTTAIVVGFAICVAIGVAYVSGRRNHNANAGPNRITSEQVRRGAINPNVLDINSARDSSDTEVPPSNEEDAPARPASDRQPATPSSAKPTPANFTGAGIEKGLPRQSGLNYVIVQSYGDEKTANDAVAALDTAGIPCTIERKLKDWSETANLYTVVGIHGFARMKNSPEYNEYMKSIELVGKRFANSTKAKSFKPAPYRWKVQ